MPFLPRLLIDPGMLIVRLCYRPNFSNLSMCPVQPLTPTDNVTYSAMSVTVVMTEEVNDLNVVIGDVL